MKNWEDFVPWISKELGLKPFQVKGTLRLLLEGNTIPFITRYRKEVTGGLDEENIRAIQERYEYYKALEERRQVILRTIEEQGKLTEELRQKILSATCLKTLEDLYLPFRPKRRTLACIAKEKGLEPLARVVWENKGVEVWEAEFSKILKKNISQGEVFQGVQHILAEWISENLEVREKLRRIFWEEGVLEVSPTEEEKQRERESKFRDYFQFSEKVSEIPPHRILAINRGEREKALRVKLKVPEEKIFELVQEIVAPSCISFYEELWQKSIRDSFLRLLYPSLTREVRSELTAKAERHALQVFARNLRQVLLTPPVRGRRVLGIDPGYRTGCKLAAVDEIGRLLEVGTIYPHKPQGQWEESKQVLRDWIEKHDLNLIAIGNGTAHRETEELVSELLEELDQKVEYLIVNEAGASVYSTSKEAQEEFPNLPAELRGTVSIARRVQDPLAEIVKIDPKSVGVGLYQHDVSQKLLKKKVEEVVESCVNYVGVDVNTASLSLLRHVSGLNRLQARRICEYREKHGPFRSRKELLRVRGIGEETFTQAAGFLRIIGGENPLDNTQIHPESYDKARELLARLGFSEKDLLSREKRERIVRALERVNLSQMARELEIGEPTLRDIVENLKKPGRDPREDFSPPVFRRGILRLEDLKVGMELEGTVRNVVDFGVFVDIGLKEDGLVHISELSDKYVSSPHEVVSVGDRIRVKVLEVDLVRRRVALSCRHNAKPKGKRQKEKKALEEVGTLGVLLRKELKIEENKEKY